MRPVFAVAENRPDGCVMTYYHQGDGWYRFEQRTPNYPLVSLLLSRREMARELAYWQDRRIVWEARR